MEENMQAVGGILGNLKSMATDMGAEIEKQNSQLDRINDKVHVLLFYFKTMLTVSRKGFFITKLFETMFHSYPQNLPLEAKQSTLNLMM